MHPDMYDSAQLSRLTGLCSSEVRYFFASSSSDNVIFLYESILIETNRLDAGTGGHNFPLFITRFSVKVVGDTARDLTALIECTQTQFYLWPDGPSVA